MKKKSLIIGGAIAAVVLVVVLCLVCCHGSKNAYCSTIPKDAVGLIKIDAFTFLEKHDIDMNALKSAAGPDAEEMLKNLGVDTEKPIYGYATVAGEAGIVAAIKDKDALTDMINSMGAMMGIKTSEKKGYTWIEGSSLIGAYDDSRLLILTGAGMNGRQHILDQMEQKENESVMETNMFERITKTDKPFALTFNTLNLPPMVRQMAVNQYKSLGLTSDDLDADFLMSFDIVKDKAILAFDYIPNNNKLKEITETYGKDAKKIDGKFINTMGENPVVWMACNIPGDKMGELIKTQLNETLTSMSNGQTDEMAMAKTVVDMVVKVVTSINGDVSFAVPNADFQTFLAQFSTSNNGLFDVVKKVGDLSQGQIQSMPVGDNVLCVSAGEAPFFCAYKDCVTTITNQQGLTDAASKPASSAIEEMKSEIKDCYFFATIDAKPIVSLLMQSGALGVLGNLYMARFNNLDRLNVTCKDFYHAEISLSVADGKDFVETMFK